MTVCINENAQLCERPVVVYTMTSGLGDALVLGDVISKLQKRLPAAEYLIVHRRNPHLGFWQKPDGSPKRCFDIHQPADWFRLMRTLRNLKNKDRACFGLQMAPGSLQGFALYRFLKLFGLIDYIVDFNLINADIVTPAEGDYILDRHLNQLTTLFHPGFTDADFSLDLPAPLQPTQGRDTFESLPRVGIHPWSRRGYSDSFVWSHGKWVELIYRIQQEVTCQIVLFGKDSNFDQFQKTLQDCKRIDVSRLSFEPSGSVPEFSRTTASLDMLVSVNTAAVHIGYAVGLPMVILCGPTLDLWVPKGEKIAVVRDRAAVFTGADRAGDDELFGSVNRIEVEDVWVQFCRIFPTLESIK